MKKAASKSALPKGSSAVIKPGTGSGSRPMSGNTKTPVSAPMDKHTMGRSVKGALK